MMRMWIEAFLPPPRPPIRSGPEERKPSILPQPTLQATPCAAERRAKQYEEALRYLAKHAFATRDWRFAQAILNGSSIEEAKAQSSRDVGGRR